ncbi:Arm DNA-binding domain-containing protein [Pararoseomonas sp. SCSIO 73927]|uniref:Arm DNA-binding domain-containing protein n=1 Tax=Pararoseomonas sp. SCSIO 73927 TaxID=3114537 RepID=UPI0030D2C355
MAADSARWLQFASGCFRGASGSPTSDQGRDRSGQVARLTKRAGETAEVRASEYFIWCDELPGFGVRIYPSGRRGYLVQYRSAGRSRRANIGFHGRLTADEARKEAMKLLGQVAKGGDPAEERATRRASLTVRELCDRYLAAAE